MTVTPEAIEAAQAHDLSHRPPGRSWCRVPDDQLGRLLEGAAPLIAADAIRSAAREQFEQAIREVTDSALEPMKAEALKAAEQAVDGRLGTVRAVSAMAERDSLRLDLPAQPVTLRGHSGEPVAAVLRCGLLYLTEARNEC